MRLPEAGQTISKQHRVVCGRQVQVGILCGSTGFLKLNECHVVGKVKSLGRKVKLYFEKKERGGQRYSSSLGVGTHPSPCGVLVVDTL